MRVVVQRARQAQVTIDGAVKGAIDHGLVLLVGFEDGDGNRPSFTDAGDPDTASKLYDTFNQQLAAGGVQVATGEFGADMQVSLTNDGPVTICYDTDQR